VCWWGARAREGDCEVASTAVRIVSLLPSATEILFALGAGDDVVGVTFECDHPVEARTRRIVSTSTLPEGLDAAGIDAAVSERLAAGEDLYRLDAGALAELDADLVVTQDLCAVCAVDVSEVHDALAYLQCSAEVLTLDPQDLEQVFASIAAVADVTGTLDAASSIVAGLRQRLAAVEDDVRGRRRPRTLVLEWTDPPFAPGHWVPDMVRLAGGDCVLGEAGTRSQRTSWDAVAAARPQVVVCAPCGYRLDGAAALAEDLLRRYVLPDAVEVWAVDANASWARPGPRLVDGVEALASILHPDRRPAPNPQAALRLT
jgi:iron complex transport system substrate-binding protein